MRRASENGFFSPTCNFIVPVKSCFASNAPCAFKKFRQPFDVFSRRTLENNWLSKRILVVDCAALCYCKPVSRCVGTSLSYTVTTGHTPSFFVAKVLLRSVESVHFNNGGHRQAGPQGRGHKEEFIHPSKQGVRH